MDGATQTVVNSTSLSTQLQMYSSTSNSQIQVYKGTLQYMSDNYYHNYAPYYGPTYCWQDSAGNIYCDYYYWYNYGYSPSYGNTVTITESQNVISVTRSQESGSGCAYGYWYSYGYGCGYGLWSVTLTHYNGAQDTYYHVYSDTLTQSGASTVQSSSVATNTFVNTVVNQVPQTVPCQACIPTHTTVYVSILQMIFNAY